MLPRKLSGALKLASSLTITCRFMFSATGRFRVAHKALGMECTLTTPATRGRDMAIPARHLHLSPRLASIKRGENEPHD
jgi:hypothetical protein